MLAGIALSSPDRIRPLEKQHARPSSADVLPTCGYNRIVMPNDETSSVVGLLLSTGSLAARQHILCLVNVLGLTPADHANREAASLRRQRFLWAVAGPRV